MGGHFALIFALLLLIIPAPPARAQDDPDAIRVGVIVQGADGLPQTFCVTLAPGATGLDALEATGLPLASERGPLGATVCRVGETGCTPPGEHCFCQCEGGPGCAYWSYFGLQNGAWQYRVSGAASVTLEDGAVEGWWWRDDAQQAAPPPVVTFEALCPADPAFPRTVTDGLGREITLDAPPQRMASVSLGADEILLPLVGPERLLGVSALAANPAISNVAGALDRVPRADLTGDPERLISLDADLVVLASYNNPAALDQLLDAGVPVFVLDDFNTLDDIRANIRLLGEATGTEIRAEALIAQMDARLDAVRAAVAGQPPVRALYYEPGGVTYGPGSTVDQIITLAGGVNVAAEAGLGAYPLIDAEFVIAADPDVILLGGWFAGAADPLAAFLADPAFADLRAVREGSVVPIRDAHLTNVSQHIAAGVEDVARALYPEAFPDDDPATG
ncbi:MAG TPA: ABC transporter substrate-binding protein [Aggregatilineaceae bacterium]|nr:ABC transporter substrate-binding protein [Aggregatilineaceae bacterium]